MTAEVSLVIPVYNEAENITATLERIAAQVHTPAEILIVYDFDADTTLPVVRGLMREMPQIRLVRNDLGRGVLNAMRTGIASAATPWVLISMADGSDDLAGVDRMVQLGRDGADLVAASRYMRGGSQVGGPRLKRFLSRAAGLSLHWVGGVPIHDATNNFKLYRASFLAAQQIQSRGGFELAIELTVKATLQGRAMAEVPTTWTDRTAGSSRFRMRAWLPLYLKWYAALFRGRGRQLADRLRGRGSGRGGSADG